MILIFLLQLLFHSYSSAQSDQNNHVGDISREYYQIALHFEKMHAQQKAKECYQKAIALDDSNHAAHIKLGSLAYEAHEIADALIHFNNALTYKPNDAHIFFNIGQCYVQQGEWQKALETFEKAVLYDPSHDKAYIQLGVVAEKLARNDQAIAHYQKAIEINANSFEAYHHLGNFFKHHEQLSDAVEAYQCAHILQPNNVTIMMHLANTLNMLDRNQESLELYEKIVEKNPTILSALYNFGFTLKKMGHLGRAIEVYQELLKQKPDYAPAHFSLSTIYLTLGDLQQGWEEYEWRWKAYHEEPRAFAQPTWRGENLAGRTLLVYAEQGFGDTFQFIRYLKVLKNKAKDACIIFESPQPLVPLLKLQPYIDHVITRHDRIPVDFHYQIPLMSLPYILKTRLDTIPTHIPYIEPSLPLIERWHTKLAADKNFKIGICWQGNARYSTQALRRAVALKSIQLEQFAPLFEIPGVSIYSLQQSDGIEQINNCSFKEKLITFDTTFDQDNGRFMDTTAVMKHLDLVISVDTSIGHLAAAMNIPTWILLPYPADWRWLLNRSDSPWYPSIRLFRQSTAATWDSVIAEVVKEIIDRTAPNKPKEPYLSSRSNNRPTSEQQFFFEQLLKTLI